MLALLLSTFIACQSEDSTTVSKPVAEVDLRPNVRVETIKEQAFVRTLSLPATIFAERSAILAPKAQGRIDSVNVNIGDTVSKDDILMEIESSDYIAGYTEANAAYELAQIQAKQANKSAQRFAELLKKGAVTQSQWEEVDMGAQLAAGQATRAKAGLEIASSRLKGTKLRAPFDGVIVTKTIEQGELMGGPAARPPLQIVDLSTVRIQASVGETDAIALTENQNGSLEIPGKHEHIPIQLSRINQAVDLVVKTVLIESVLNNDGHALKHNQSATLHLELEQTAMAIPRQALLNRQSQSADVFVLIGNRVERRSIQYGRSETDYIPVFTGVSMGEQVLVAGHNRLQDGVEVLVLGAEQ
jgi:RND family efflux transporter MFP subunit